MALEHATFKIITSLRPRLPASARVLCLGYPDLLVPKEDLVQAGICHAEEQLPLATDADAIARWHGWKDPIFDTATMFNRLGLTPAFIDIHPSRGIEQVVDLNMGLPIEMHGMFDLVLDGGTLEHCFNIGRAFMNVAQAVREGGFILHSNPMSCFNHGFWNLSATTYHDFYTQNGFEVLDLFGMLGKVGQREVAPLPPADRIQLPPEVSSLVVVRKIAKQPLRWPTQGKYLKNKTLKG
ncbi:MAG: hypothetical protein HY082_11430 [Gammaproteobacteria bacterium]|nr:hypothetical protein [Gammaproteobacteria bacterium]